MSEEGSFTPVTEEGGAASVWVVLSLEISGGGEETVYTCTLGGYAPPAPIEDGQNEAGDDGQAQEGDDGQAQGGDDGQDKEGDNEENPAPVLLRNREEPAEHVHAWSYSGVNDTITATCTAADCPITEGPTLTISAPENLSHDGEPKAATLNTGYSTQAFGTPTIVYLDADGATLNSAPVAAGDYSAVVTFGDEGASVSAVVSYTVTALQSPVSYRYYENGWHNGVCTQYTEVQSNTTTWDQVGEESWYVVKGDVSISERITVAGTAILILCDGARLTASAGINTHGATFSIHPQSAGTGALIATGSDGGAGIGGNSKQSSGVINIHGGNINATGGSGGIGVINEASVKVYASGDMTVTGGTIGLDNAATQNNSATVEVYSGGKLTASGGVNGIRNANGATRAFHKMPLRDF